MHFVAQATSTVFVQLQKPTGVLPSTKQREENKTFNDDQDDGDVDEYDDDDHYESRTR